MVARGIIPREGFLHVRLYARIIEVLFTHSNPITVHSKMLLNRTLFKKGVVYSEKILQT